MGHVHPYRALSTQKSPLTQPLPARGIAGLRPQPAHLLLLLFDLVIKLSLMFVVIGQSRMYLREGQASVVLEEDLFGTPSMSQMIERYLNNLRICSDDPRNAVVIDFDWSGGNSRHRLTPLGHLDHTELSQY